MNLCKNENCNEKALYGLVNTESGMFEKHHCKIHKENGEIGSKNILEAYQPIISVEYLELDGFEFLYNLGYVKEISLTNNKDPLSNSQYDHIFVHEDIYVK